MRKKLFLGIIVTLVVFLLIFVIENFIFPTQYLLLIFRISGSTAWLIAFSSLIGFLIGFFAMLYSHEVRREKEMAKDADIVPPAPEPEQKVTAAEVAKEAPKEDEKEATVVAEPESSFDEDDEILG